MGARELGKATDGVVSRYLNRRFSLFITTRFLADTAITPNQLTWIIFAFSLQAVPAYLLGLYWLGGLIAQLGSMLDGCDGELARLKGMTSELGAFYDAVLDRYADVITLAALTCRLAWDLGPQLSAYAWLAGLMAAVGGLMTSYSWHLIKTALKGGDVRWPTLLSDSRDMRMLLVAVGSVLAHVDPRILLAPLAWIAIVTNAKAFYRLAVAHRFLRG
ncbi:MAG: hypothetical protein DRK00_09685 [Thermoprotei archaeon]|nr:MAG: hypothetical protein DRK00_09685 [Thermoprotei archaeon]